MLLILFWKVVWSQFLPLAALVAPNGAFSTHNPEAFDGCSLCFKQVWSWCACKHGPARVSAWRAWACICRLFSGRRREEEKKLRESCSPFLKLVLSKHTLVFFGRQKVHIVSMRTDLASSFSDLFFWRWSSESFTSLLVRLLLAGMTGFWVVQPKQTEWLKPYLDAWANSCLLTGCESKCVWWGHCDLQFVLEVSPFVRLCFARCFFECLQLSSPFFLSLPSDTNMKTLRRREQLLWALSVLRSTACDTVGYQMDGSFGTNSPLSSLFWETFWAPFIFLIAGLICLNPFFSRIRHNANLGGPAQT